jgi:hypothetical protein
MTATIPLVSTISPVRRKKAPGDESGALSFLNDDEDDDDLTADQGDDQKGDHAPQPA